MTKRARIVVNTLVIGLVVMFLIALLLPAVSSGPRAPQAMCRNNLHNIALALHNYLDAYQTFPPAYIADDRGAPIHSWRVLSLPYLDQAPLYQEYDFSEPWDGPANAALAGEVGAPAIYQCPEDVHSRETPQPWTSYVAIVGPHTAFPGDQPTTVDDFTDGLANTLLVVESHNTGIHWMEPRDLHVGQMALTINGAGQGISSPHQGGAFVMFGDGRARFLENTIDPTVLRRLQEIDDGEEVPQF